MIKRALFFSLHFVWAKKRGQTIIDYVYVCMQPHRGDLCKEDKYRMTMTVSYFFFTAAERRKDAQQLGPTLHTAIQWCSRTSQAHRVQRRHRARACAVSG